MRAYTPGYTESVEGKPNGDRLPQTEQARLKHQQGEHAMTLQQAFNKFMQDSDRVRAALDLANKEGWRSGENCLLEIIEQGDFRVVLRSTLPLDYETPGILLVVPSTEAIENEPPAPAYDDELENAPTAEEIALETLEFDFERLLFAEESFSKKSAPSWSETAMFSPGTCDWCAFYSGQPDTLPCAVNPHGWEERTCKEFRPAN